MCIMCTGAKASAFRPDDKGLDDDTHAALAYIGVNKEYLYEGTFPNIEMNTVLDKTEHVHPQETVKSVQFWS